MSETTKSKSAHVAVFANRLKWASTCAELAAIHLETGDPAGAMQWLDNLHNASTDADAAAAALMKSQLVADAAPIHRGVGEGDSGLPSSAECQSEKTSPQASPAVRLEIVAANLDAVWRLADTIRRLPGIALRPNATISKVWGNAELSECRRAIS